MFHTVGAMIRSNESRRVQQYADAAAYCFCINLITWKPMPHAPSMPPNHKKLKLQENINGY